jgi:cyclase
MKTRLGAVFALALGPVLLCPPLTGHPQVYNYLAHPKPPPLAIIHLGGGLYVAKGDWGSNVGFYVENNQVLAVDSKATAKATERAIQEISRITQSPITRVVYTHSDPDSFNGREAYPPGAAVICSLGLTKDWMRYFEFFLEMNAPLEIYKSYPTSDFVPAITFDGQLNIRIGRKEVELYHYGSAHTRGDALVVFPDERIAFIGDLVFVGHDPLIQGPKGGNSDGLVRVLSILLNIKPEIRTFVPSHAGPIGREDIRRTLEFIEDVKAKVKAMVEAGKTLDDVKSAFGVRPSPEEPGAWVWPSFGVIVYHELVEYGIK